MVPPKQWLKESKPFDFLLGKGVMKAWKTIQCSWSEYFCRWIIFAPSLRQEPLEGTSYPKIVSTNREVEAVNCERLESLPGEEYVFHAQDTGYWGQGKIQSEMAWIPPTFCIFLLSGGCTILDCKVVSVSVDQENYCPSHLAKVINSCIPIVGMRMLTLFLIRWMLTSCLFGGWYHPMLSTYLRG